jgi:peptide chain release factor 1
MKKSAIEPVVAAFSRYQSLSREMDDLISAASQSQDPDLAAMAGEDIPRVRGLAARTLEQVKRTLVSSDTGRVGSVMLEVRAGTGGDEAAIWARDLLDMYQRLATRRKWAFETLDATPEPQVDGVRAAVVNIRGENVWSELGFEAGVHSVKRVPATEAQGRIHTSTATVAVLPEPEEVDVKIDWANDVNEDVTTSQGPGGQNVNKVATAVKLFHKPTGIEVRMQESKSQQQNREKARRLLMARVYELERQKQHRERTAARNAQIGSGERSEKPARHARGQPGCDHRRPDGAGNHPAPGGALRFPAAPGPQRTKIAQITRRTGSRIAEARPRYAKNDGIFTPPASAIALTMKFGPLPM